LLSCDLGDRMAHRCSHLHRPDDWKHANGYRLAKERASLIEIKLDAPLEHCQPAHHSLLEVALEVFLSVERSSDWTNFIPSKRLTSPHRVVQRCTTQRIGVWQPGNVAPIAPVPNRSFTTPTEGHPLPLIARRRPRCLRSRVQKPDIRRGLCRRETAEFLE
jgi:hypothetical protein